MEARRRTWFDDRGLVIAAARSGGAGDAGAAPDAGRPVPFYAGAMHYWRVEPSRWARCLTAMHDLGFTIVETYVPWRVHEVAPGQRNWERERDLARFLAAAQAAGLSVVLRPGPHVNAELTSFGMPDHVLGDAACQARSATGSPVWMPSPPRMWPVPSYASRAFRSRVVDWYAAVGEVVKPFLAPDGPVIAVGVDNEAQMFFRVGAYDHDYHPDAVEQWRATSGLDGEPPRAWDPDDAARCISWVRFKDQYIAHALAAFAAALDAAGFAGLARFHNLPPGYHGLYDLRGIQRAIAGPVGIDAYSPRDDFRELRRRAAAAVGNASPVPIAFEVGVGFFPWFPPLDAGDDPTRERDQLLSLLAVGLRGFNIYMAVERDRYYGAAIDKTGTPEPYAGWIRTLLTTLAEIGWTELRRAPAVAVVDTRADARFGQASCAIDPMSPVVAEVLGLGPGGAAELGTDPAAITQRRWQTAIARALDLARVPYVIVDESVSEAELIGLRAVIVPTLERLDRGLAHTLRGLTEHGHAGAATGPSEPVDSPSEAAASAGTSPAASAGTAVASSADDAAAASVGAASSAGIAAPASSALAASTGVAGAARKRVVVVIGPGTPTHDELGQPFIDPLPRRIGRLKAGSLDDIPGLATDLAALAAEPSDAWQIERPDDVHAYAHADRAGVVRAVFVASDATKPITAVLLVDESTRSLRDPFARERLAVAAGKVTIALGARAVRMLVVDR